MTITPHLLTGAALSTATNSFLVAFLLGFFSHFILDAIPHLDPGTFYHSDNEESGRWPTWIYIYAILEFIVAATIIYFLFRHRADFGLLCVGALGGIAVDIIDNNPLTFLHKLPLLKQLHWFHEKIHYDLPIEKWYWGAITTIILIGGSLWYLLKY